MTPQINPMSRSFGLGLRPEHYHALLERPAGVEWLEALTDNYLVDGGKALHFLDRLRALYPMSLHGVAMNLGGSDPIDRDYLRNVKELARRIAPWGISDHLCWTGHDGINGHDLLPLPATEEALRHVCDRISQAQDLLGQQILIENVSSYLGFHDDAMSEVEFLVAVAERADCFILLDVNNIHVSAVNHGFKAADYLTAVPVNRVRQMHLAGHRNHGHYCVDTHDEPVCDAVWQLFGAAVRRFPDVPVMIERDDNIPPLPELLDELQTARRYAAENS